MNPNQVRIELETTPAIIGFDHPQIALFYNQNHPQGATQNINEATRFTGKKEREDGMKEVMKKYPQCDRKKLIFTYLPI